MAPIDINMKSCPLTSIGTGIDMVCSGDKCAWYVPNVKKCSVYLLAYDALLDATAKQRAAKKQG
ncbi:MAG: hypothetical protein SPL70_02325 [Cyanobacteriota bacterium]|nr:hypothetical protein [Cyanobacteriota bacterium]MDY6382722.1 hypothetical protein [Cyanobacteriota bacterium]